MISEDTRAEMRVLMARYPQPRSALLPMLHLVQSTEGCVTPQGIEICAAELSITAAEVAAVATFYTMYKRHPVGDYHVGVCTNTLCAVMGGDAILARLEEHLGIGNDETTADGSITLEHIECNAACDYAPVLTVNWEFVDNQTPESAVELVDDLRAGRERSSTRGARLCTWREAERVIAGFPDGRADEGPSAGTPSLLGLSIARERNWTAAGVEGAENDGRQASDSATRTADVDSTAAEGAELAEAGVSRGSGDTQVRSDQPADRTANGSAPAGDGTGEDASTDAPVDGSTKDTT